MKLRSAFALLSLTALVVQMSEPAQASGTTDVYSWNNGPWTSAATWSNGAPAGSGNHYFIDGNTVSSPAGQNVLTFPGESITLGEFGGGGTLDIARVANFTGGLVTVNLPPVHVNAHASGQIHFRAMTGITNWLVTPATSLNVDGTLEIQNSGTGGVQNVNLQAPVSGFGTIQYRTSDAPVPGSVRTLALFAADSGFSGNWDISHGLVGDDFGAVAVRARSALGTGSVFVGNRSRLLNEADGGFDGVQSILLQGTGATVQFNHRDWASAGGTLSSGAEGVVHVGRATIQVNQLEGFIGSTIHMTVGSGKSGIIQTGDSQFTGTLAVTLEGSPIGRSYDLIRYGSSVPGNPTVVVQGDYGRLTPVLDSGSGSNDSVSLSFGGAVGNLRWQGNATSVWQNGPSPEFDNGGAADRFFSYDEVRFDASAASFAPVLSGAVIAGTVAFEGASDYFLSGSGNLRIEGDLTKDGSHTLTIASTATVTGGTQVNEGTMIVGSGGLLASTSTTIGPGAGLAGIGTIQSPVTFDSQAILQVLDLNSPLTIQGLVTFGTGFGIANLRGIDWSKLELGVSHTLITTTQTFSAADIANFGIANAASVGGNRYAYFETGSLQMVVIPEPSSAWLLWIGTLVMMWRRR
jgi:fibronectin-binding autotransporter adhesin